MQHAVVPTEKLKVGSNFGAEAFRIAVVPARALRVEGESGGRRLPDHRDVPPDAAGRPETPGYTGGASGMTRFWSPRGGKEG